MGRCILCSRETDHTAQVYIGTPPDIRSERIKTIVYQFEPFSDYLCLSCINGKLSKDFTGIGFYLAFQLLWLKVAKDRFSTFWSYLAAILAILALARLAMILIRKYYQRFRGEQEIPKYLYAKEDIEETGSSILKESLLQEMNRQGKQIKTLREYKNGGLANMHS